MCECATKKINARVNAITKLNASTALVQTAYFAPVIRDSRCTTSLTHKATFRTQRQLHTLITQFPETYAFATSDNAKE